jgi:hypothetical protein
VFATDKDDEGSPAFDLLQRSPSRDHDRERESKTARATGSSTTGNWSNEEDFLGAGVERTDLHGVAGWGTRGPSKRNLLLCPDQAFEEGFGGSDGVVMGQIPGHGGVTGAVEDAHRTQGSYLLRCGGRCTAGQRDIEHLFDLKIKGSDLGIAFLRDTGSGFLLHGMGHAWARR